MHKQARDDVAVITVSYNSSAQLDNFLKNAVSSVSSPQQIFVVDNDSSDIKTTSELCAKYSTQLIRLDQNLGYGGAVNAAVPSLPEHLTTLIVSNPDTSLNAEAIGALTECVQNTSVGVAGPRITNADGSIYPSARAIPSIRNGIGHALFANTWINNPWTRNYLSEAHLQDHTTATGWVSGACLAIRRELFESVQGFDEHYFMYFEDVDLGYRLGQKGLTNFYIPEVQVQHIGGESTKATKKAMLKIHHESAMRFISVKYSGFFWAPVRWVIRLGLALRFRIQASKATT